MFTLLIQTLNELDRLEKQVLINCFDQQADVNIFADSSDIYLTINAIPSDCQMPYGVLVSVQLNSLGGYEPQVYLEDFEYGQTQLIIVKCDNPSCANLKTSSAGVIVMESKTEVTYIPAGSVQISRGRSSNCFNDNDSYVELYQGSIVAVLYPTFRCINTITTTQGQQLILNTPLKAKVYITYTDNSITIHDQLIITVEHPIFVPSSEFSSDSVPVKVRLAHPDISQYFEQKITNGTITKDMVTFQFQFYFTTGQEITKISQTTVNYYELLGIQDAFESIQLIFLSNGFAVKKQTSQNAAAGNAYLASLGVDSYQIEYTFVTYDVEKTNEFRFRLIAQGLSNGQFNDQSIINNCNLRFPNQGCDELMKKLQSWDLSELTPSITQFFYAGNQLVTNYSKFVNEFLDSCFSTGHLDNDNLTEVLTRDGQLDVLTAKLTWQLMMDVVFLSIISTQQICNICRFPVSLQFKPNFLQILAQNKEKLALFRIIIMKLKFLQNTQNFSFFHHKNTFSSIIIIFQTQQFHFKVFQVSINMRILIVIFIVNQRWNKIQYDVTIYTKSIIIDHLHHIFGMSQKCKK
ncbi:Conserved_hypothetical protein [Hexamita inflata]|uniref:Uncharacterized protein n=1 Tax=Hexamita inflata TaxID=28002 RepID=A0ABP1GD92_9EUKA